MTVAYVTPAKTTASTYKFCCKVALNDPYCNYTNVTDKKNYTHKNDIESTYPNNPQRNA